MLRSFYSSQDFDFAIVYLDDPKVFYVFPVDVFVRYRSTVTLVETDKRQRKPKSSEYRDRWALLSEMGSPGGNPRWNPVKLGEARKGNTEPSPVK